MKTLYITRHAKSSWDFPNIQDYERPLIDKGIHKTQKVITEFVKMGIVADLIISSHAKRAYETAKLIAAGIHYPIDKIMVSPLIYNSDTETIVELLSNVDDKINKLLIVGHNPTFTSFANYFLDEKIEYLPTSGTVGITFDMQSWDHITSAPRKNMFVIFPKEISE